MQLKNSDQILISTISFLVSKSLLRGISNSLSVITFFKVKLLFSSESGSSIEHSCSFLVSQTVKCVLILVASFLKILVWCILPGISLKHFFPRFIKY